MNLYTSTPARMHINIIFVRAYVHLFASTNAHDCMHMVNMQAYTQRHGHVHPLFHGHTHLLLCVHIKVCMRRCMYVLLYKHFAHTFMHVHTCMSACSACAFICVVHACVRTTTELSVNSVSKNEHSVFVKTENVALNTALYPRSRVIRSC